MKNLNSILKFFLFLVLCVSLVLTQLFLITFILMTIQELIISNKDYLILANNTFYKYVIFFVVITTFLIITFINKKGWAKINEDFVYLGKLMYNKIFIILFSILSLIIFVLTIFNYDTIYKDKIVIHSLFNLKGTTYEYKDIKEVSVEIKKFWNGSMNANYILVFDDHKVDILGSVINVKNEEDTYDNNVIIDKKIKELKIKKNINDKHLDKYTSALDKKYADKINILFEKN